MDPGPYRGPGWRFVASPGRSAPAAVAGARATPFIQVTTMAHDPKKPAHTAPSKPFSPPPGGKPSQPSHQPGHHDPHHDPHHQPHQPGSPSPKFTDPKKK